MRILLINRFFFPDESATSLMLTDLVEGLAPLGLDMRIITAAASYTETGGNEQVLPISSLAVTRLPTLPVSHQSMVGRMANFVAFYCGLAIAGVVYARKGDIIVCLTDPPFAGVIAAVIAKIKRARLIHWVQDIYPETATRLGYGSSTNIVIRGLARMRDWAWRSACVNVVIGERMRDMLALRGVKSDLIRIIPNWAADEDLKPIAPNENPLRKQWGFSSDALVIGYSGNLGRAHDVTTMLDAAAILAADRQSNICFLFIGGGAKHAQIDHAMSDKLIGPMLTRQGYRPRAELTQSLNVPDVHWLSLEPALEGLIVPSKFYGAAAVGRPIIFVGDTDGEIARLIKVAKCGASFSKGDAAGVARFIAELSSDPALRSRLGANARRFAEFELSRSARLADWRSLMTELRFR